MAGDPDHPISKGYTCSKARALPALHHDRLRFDGPQLAGRRRHGRSRSTVEMSPSVRRGVVSMPRGWDTRDVNQLTSDLENLDIITGMPRLSGIPDAVGDGPAVRELGLAGHGNPPEGRGPSRKPLID